MSTGPPPVSNAKSEASSSSTSAGAKPKRLDDKAPIPTHFLALPLVTDTSLPQLVESIAHFQSVTTAPRPLRPSELQARQRAREQETPERDVGQEASEEVREDAAQRLKIIPAQAHRPAGTMHLTLGTMVLNNGEEMRRAVEALRSVDFGAMLGAVGGNTVNVTESQEVGALMKSGEKATAGTPVMDAGEEVASALKTLGRPISPPPASASADAGKARSTTTKVSSSDQAQPLKLDLRGLGTFPSPKRSRVFYASPHDPSERLQTFAEAVQQRFIEEGIVRKEGRALTLHATVANLKYVKMPKWHGGKNAKDGRARGREGREVDAREVIEAFDHDRKAEPGQSDHFVQPETAESYLWAKDIVIDRIRICKMGAVKSEDPAKGMEYPAIKVPRRNGEDGGEDVAEVIFA